MPDQNLPFEVTYNRAKVRIVAAINQTAQELQLPAAILSILLKDIVNENEVNSLSAIMASYDLVQPEMLAELQKAKDAVEQAKEKTAKVQNVKATPIEE